MRHLNIVVSSILFQQTDDKRAPDSVPAEADVVIIGGGSVGASTLYHLTKLGVKNAVLLERDQLTSGTTWHSAGLVWRLRPSDVEAELLAWTRELARDVLEEETGLWAGWNENGGLFIANNKERLDEYKRLMTVSFAEFCVAVTLVSCRLLKSEVSSGRLFCIY